MDITKSFGEFPQPLKYLGPPCTTYNIHNFYKPRQVFESLNKNLGFETLFSTPLCVKDETKNVYICGIDD